MMPLLDSLIARLDGLTRPAATAATAAPPFADVLDAERQLSSESRTSDADAAPTPMEDEEPSSAAPTLAAPFGPSPHVRIADPLPTPPASAGTAEAPAALEEAVPPSETESPFAETDTVSEQAAPPHPTVGNGSADPRAVVLADTKTQTSRAVRSAAPLDVPALPPEAGPGSEPDSAPTAAPEPTQDAEQRLAPSRGEAMAPRRPSPPASSRPDAFRHSTHPTQFPAVVRDDSATTTKKSAGAPAVLDGTVTPVPLGHGASTQPILPFDEHVGDHTPSRFPSGASSVPDTGAPTSGGDIRAAVAADREPRQRMPSRALDGPTASTGGESVTEPTPVSGATDPARPQATLLTDSAAPRAANVPSAPTKESRTIAPQSTDDTAQALPSISQETASTDAEPVRPAPRAGNPATDRQPALTRSETVTPRPDTADADSQPTTLSPDPNASPLDAASEVSGVGSPTSSDPAVETPVDGAEPPAPPPAAPTVRPSTPPSDARASAAPTPLPTRLAVPSWLGKLSPTTGGRGVQVALGEDGTVRLQTTREADGVTVSIRFSDPDLQALAGAHAARLRDVLDAHFAEPVRLSFSDGLGADAGTPDGHASGDGRAAGAPPSSGDPSTPAPDPSPSSRPLASSDRREWIG